MWYDVMSVKTKHLKKIKTVLKNISHIAIVFFVILFFFRYLHTAKRKD